jgi:hypothetical protein
VWQRSWDDDNCDGDSEEWETVSLGTAIQKLEVIVVEYNPDEWAIRFGTGCEETLAGYTSLLHELFDVVNTNYYREGD